MATRIAVAIVLCCIGLMLLSACGFGLRRDVPYVPPLVASRVFLLLGKDAHGQPSLLGHGTVQGNSFRLLDGTLTLEASSCAPREIYSFAASIDGSPSRIHLTARRGGHPVVSLDGAASYEMSHGLVQDLRFSGNLTNITECADRLQPPPIAVEGVPFEPIKQSFHGTARGPNGSSIGVTLSIDDLPFNLTGDFTGRSSIAFTGVPCFQSGSRENSYTQNINARDAREIYTMNDGSTVTANIARAPWRGQTREPLPVHLSIAGGKCDGQTFDLTMTAF